MRRAYRLALLLISFATPVFAGVVPTPPLQLWDEGIGNPISFIVDCQGTGIVCDFNAVTGRLQVKVDGAASGTASTANALADDPADCVTAGHVPTGINASGTAMGCFDVASQVELDAVNAAKQSLDPELTALANLVCVNGIAEYVAGTLTCGVDDGTGLIAGVSSFNGRAGDVVPVLGDYTATIVGSAATGSVAATTTQAAIAELAAEKIDAATLAVLGTINTPANPVDWSQLKNVPAGFADGSDDGTGGGGGVTSFNGRTGDIVPVQGDYTGAHITITPGGDLSSSTAGSAIAELDTEKAALAALGTNDSTANQPGDLVSWYKLKDIPSDFADGSDASSVGGGADGLQANADVQRQITNAVDLASAVCIGSTDHKWCWHGNSTEGAVETIFPAQDMNRILAAGFDHNIKAADGTNIATFDEATKTLIVPNQIVSPGIVKHFEATTAPTINDDVGAGFAVHSEWTNTTPEPDQIWICTDATAGAAKWTQITSFTQVDKSLQDAANIGRTITTLTNEANALVLGDGTGGKKFWNDPAEGWREEVFPPGNQVYNIASTFALLIKYDDTEIVRWDASGNQTWSNQGRPTISIPWTAGSVETDGTNCATQAQANLTGFRLQDFGCVAFTTGAGQFTLHIPMRTGWDPTVALPFTLRVRTVGGTSLAWIADVSMWCFGEDEALPTDTQFNGVTPQEINITTGTTAGLRKGDTTAAITPGGSCADNDTLAVRVRTKTGHTATAAAARVFEGLVHAKYDKLGD